MATKPLECVVMSIDLRERVRVNRGDDRPEPGGHGDPSVGRVVGVGARHGGRALQTEAGRVLMRFPTPDEAVRAACGIQALFNSALAVGQAQVIYRIGMHFGALRPGDGELDAPVFAGVAQAAAHATRKQILLTEDTADHLSPTFRQMVFEIPERLDEQEDNQALYELVCHQDDFGGLTTDARDQVTLAGGALHLTYQGREWRVSAQSSAMIAGRSPQSDILVEGPLVSRFHARFEYRQGKFVLVDQSRNGSYIQFQTGKEVYLKHQELDLWGSGTVYLGERNAGPEARIEFACAG